MYRPGHENMVGIAEDKSNSYENICTRNYIDPVNFIVLLRKGKTVHSYTNKINLKLNVGCNESKMNIFFLTSINFNAKIKLICMKNG